MWFLVWRLSGARTRLFVCLLNFHLTMPVKSKCHRQQPADVEENSGSDGPLDLLVSSNDGSDDDDGSKRVAEAAARAEKRDDEEESEDEDEEESEDDRSDVEVPNLKCASCGKMSQEVLTSVG